MTRTISATTRSSRALLAVTVLALVTAAGALLPSGSAEALALRHLTLDHALPGPDSVMSAQVTEVRLFFSEPPQMRATSVRITDGGRGLIATSPPSAYEGDQRQVYVRLDTPLPPGGYVVQWRVMAQDGHIQRGDYTFRVSAD